MSDAAAENKSFQENKYAGPNYGKYSRKMSPSPPLCVHDLPQRNSFPRLLMTCFHVRNVSFTLQ